MHILRPGARLQAAAARRALALTLSIATAKARKARDHDADDDIGGGLDHVAEWVARRYRLTPQMAKTVACLAFSTGARR